MRYFFISYSHNLGFGSLTIQLEEFPNEQGIFKTLQEEAPGDKDLPKIESITILSLFEFKTKEDFDSFNRSEE
jgi:hypothetical protein